MRKLLPLFLIFFLNSADSKKVSKKENAQLQELCANAHGELVRSKRLLYGKQADHSSDNFKHAVNIQIGIDEVASRCSGTIISSRHVLTAAHCFSHKELCNVTSETSKLYPHKRTFVHFGGNCVVLNPHTGKCDGGVANQKIEATRVVIPNRYTETSCFAGDIAIVEIPDKVLTSSDATDFACLPVKNQTVPERLIAAGYGSDPNNREVAQKYKEWAEFKSERYCDFALGAPKDSLCTEEERSFLCKGDSGSGVVQTVADNKKVIFGVHSRGTKCSVVQAFVDNPIPGRRFKGSINTDVRRYLKFICGNTGVCPPGINPKVKKLTTVLFEN